MVTKRKICRGRRVNRISRVFEYFIFLRTPIALVYKFIGVSLNEERNLFFSES